jgi:hypothetical protein
VPPGLGDKLLEIFISGIQASPIIAFLSFMWWRADTERRSWQEKYEALTERALKGLSDSTKVAEASSDGMRSLHQTLSTIKDMLLMLAGIKPQNDGE